MTPTKTSYTEDLTSSPSTLRSWVERDEIDRGDRDGTTSAEAAEIRRLRKENSELRRANEILKTGRVFRGGGARPPTQVIVAYIDAYRDRFGIEPITRVLSEHGIAIAASTYHAAKASPVSPRDLADAYATNALVDVFRANRRVSGLRKLWHAMRRAGYDVGRDQTARLMRIAGITGVVRGRHTTTTTTRGDRSAARHPDLCDRAWDTPTRPDQWWVADFERHEALLNLAVVKGHRCRLVAAGRWKLRAA